MCQMYHKSKLGNISIRQCAENWAYLKITIKHNIIHLRLIAWNNETHNTTDECINQVLFYNSSFILQLQWRLYL